MERENHLFNNPEIRLDELPEAESLELIPLEKAYKTARYASASITAGILTMISWLIVLFQPEVGLIGQSLAVLVTLISVWMVFYNGLSYKYMSYAVREKDISYKSGWLWKSMTTVPFIRVQHCDIRQGLLDRRFGLAKLTIYTAGGQSTDLMIPGLLPETAERLKTFILNATEQSVEKV